MDVFRRIVYSACLAGLVSGLFLTGVQAFRVLPIIIEAETYENGSAQRHGDDAHHGTTGLWTAISNIGMGVGFGLLLSAVYALRVRVTWRQGLLWGIGGYVTFFLAPAIGLPPEIPGVAVTALEPRQLWWLLTVTFTGIGLLLAIFGPPWWARAIGVALLPVPHLIGAPQPETYSGLAPEALSEAFFLSAAVVNAVFWLVLGASSAVFYRQPRRTT